MRDAEQPAVVHARWQPEHSISVLPRHEACTNAMDPISGDMLSAHAISKLGGQGALQMKVLPTWGDSKQIHCAYIPLDNLYPSV